MAIYEIDGERFSTLEEFYSEIDRVMRLSAWGHNLDAFNDVLRGGFGTPQEGFTIRWKNHGTSKADSAIRKLFANSSCDWSDAILVTASPFRDICRMQSRRKIKPHLIGWWISFAGTDAAVRKNRMEWN